MKAFFKLIPFIQRYPRATLANIVFNFLAILFSLFSLTLIYPFLQILFGKAEILTSAPNFTFSANYFFNYINFLLAKMVSNYGKQPALLLVCGFVILVFFLKNLFHFLAKYFLAIIRNHVIADLRHQLYNKILELPLAFFSEKKKGDTLARATVDIQEVEWGVLSVLELIFVSPLSILLSLIFLFSINTQLTLAVLILAPVAGFLIGSVGKTLKKVSSQAQDKMGGLLAQLEETMGGLDIIKGFTAEQYFLQKFETTNRAHANLMTKMLHRRDLSSPLSEFLSVSVVVVVLYLGTRMVLNNEALDSAQFITYLAILSQLIPPAKAFTDAYFRIIKGSASLDRIEEIINTPNLINDAPDAQKLLGFDQQIEFKNVDFGYSHNKKVLENINFTLPKGKVLALVGSSGSGKTTLSKLLVRFYEADAGEILIDGLSIKNITQKSLRQQMGIVSQHPTLFNDTVFNNIALGATLNEATKQRVVEAAKVANAHEFIVKLAKGYATNIGDGGFLLSGGQRQRLTIARAIFNDAPVLILDEATSALDTESEKLVQNAIEKLLQNRTVLVIAHRLSTVRYAHQILVMHEGKIVERGTHDSLMALKQAYFKMVRLQN